MEPNDAGVVGVSTSATSALQVEVSEQTRRHARSETRSTTTSETTVSTHPTRSNGKPWILYVMERIDMKAVRDHFSKFDKDSKGDIHENEMGGGEPFLVANHVSLEALREYYEHRSYEGLKSKHLRFLELSDDGHLWIVDFPSDVHEGIAGEFEWVFGCACPALRDYLGSWGHTTIYVNNQGKEADKSYGPGRNVLNSVRPQNLQEGARWLTFVVEIGRWQCWPSLRRWALQWYGYPGIQYILLIQVNERATSLSYELYDALVNPLVANDLPAVTLMNFYYDPTGGSQENITLDGRRILGIPQGQFLPNSVSATVTIDLRLVLDNVNHTL
jgi:hypothetical protein